DREAHDRLSSWLLGRWVHLERDDHDVSARGTSVYVVREDGLFVNAALVREGLARVSAHAALARRDELVRAEADARASRRGLWSDGRIGSHPFERDVFGHPNSAMYTSRSWPRSLSSTPSTGKSANATSSITASITGRSGSSSSSSPPA